MAMYGGGKRDDKVVAEKLRLVVVVWDTPGHIPRHPVAAPPEKTAFVHGFFSETTIVPTPIFPASWDGTRRPREDLQATSGLCDCSFGGRESSQLLDDLL